MNKERVAELILSLSSNVSGCLNPLCHVCSRNRADLIEFATELQIPSASIIPSWLREPRREGTPL